MLLNISLLLGGLLLLIWSSDRFVFGAAAFARNMGLPPFLIGLTIVAVGSSAPEMFVAAASSLQGKTDTAIGNVLGSNIANITLILGFTALMRTITVSSQTLLRELPLMLITSLVAVWFIHDRQLSFFEGAVLAILFLSLMGYLIHDGFQNKYHEKDNLSDKFPDEVPKNVKNSHAVLWLIFGLILLPLSANWMVDGAVGIAKYFGLSDLMIGLTIVAIGTSLPELAASITSLLKNEDDLAVGNVVGSNLFNILAVLAIPGIIAPNSPKHLIDIHASTRDSYIMLGVTILLIGLIFIGKKPYRLSRWQGGLLLSLFFGYQFLLFSQSA